MRLASARFGQRLFGLGHRIVALFEGTVAFVMISATIKSMDPAREESARVLGAGKWRGMVTLRLVLPGVAGAAVFVFPEIPGSFAAAHVLGIPARFVVITTAILQAMTMYPSDYGRAAALGTGLFVVMFLTLSLYRVAIRRGHCVPAASDGSGSIGLDFVCPVSWPMSSPPWSCPCRGSARMTRLSAGWKIRRWILPPRD